MSDVINIDKPFEDFKRHLEELPNNDRIIFSGKYGIGKSYFLKKYFEKNEERYFPLFINPVNYSSAQTHDIIQLIKFDIFYQLLEEGKIEIEEDINLTASQVLYYHLQKDAALFIPPIIAILKFARPDLEDVFKTSGALFALWEKFAEKAKTQKEKIIGKSEKTKLEEFYSKVQTMPGSPFQDDFVMHLIEYSIKKIQKKESKKVVIIIDDLDRLEPDNMFRILNVLSAHSISGNNKSAFENTSVVLVCDIDNVEVTYRHRYGANADFDGFMDKFYSNHMFLYKNKHAIALYIKSLPYHMSEEGKHLFLWFLNYFLEQNKITVRQLIKAPNGIVLDKSIVTSTVKYKNLIKRSSIPTNLIKYTMQIDNNCFIQSETIYTTAEDIELLYIYRLLVNVIGDEAKLFSLLNQFSKGSKFISLKNNVHILKPIIKSLIVTDPVCAQTFSLDQYSGMGYPKNTLLGFRYQINLNWTPRNKYEGNESYYKNSTVELDSTQEKNRSYTVSQKDFFTIVNDQFEAFRKNH